MGSFCCVCGDVDLDWWQVTDRIDEKLVDKPCTPTTNSTCPGGNPLNIIEPAGYLALLLFTLSCFALWLFGKWAAHRVSVHAKRFHNVVKQQTVRNLLHADADAQEAEQRATDGMTKATMPDVARAKQLDEQLPEDQRIGNRSNSSAGVKQAKGNAPVAPGAVANPTKY